MPAEMNEEHVEVEPNYELSSLDKAYMTLNYPFFSTSSRQGNMTRETALRQVGMSSTDRAWRVILDSTSATEIRDEFTDWSDRQRARYLVNLPSRDLEEDADDEVNRGAEAGDEVEEVTGWCASQTPRAVKKEAQAARALRAVEDAPARGVTVVADMLWQPGDTLRYYFQQKEYQGELKTLTPARGHRRYYFEQALIQWARWSNLKFIPAFSGTKQEAEIRIFFYEQENPEYREYYRPRARNSTALVSKSAIGRLGEDFTVDGEPVIPEMDWGFDDTTVYLELPPAPWTQGTRDFEDAWSTILHEIGHVLGLRHEFSSPLSRTVANELGSDEREAIDAWTPWDPLSIMMYGNLNIKKPEGRDWLPEEMQKTPRNTKLSESDKFFIAVST